MSDGQPMQNLIATGSRCSAPGCATTYRGEPEHFIEHHWSLMPVERFAFCPSHSGTPEVLDALRRG